MAMPAIACFGCVIFSCILLVNKETLKYRCFLNLSDNKSCSSYGTSLFEQRSAANGGVFQVADMPTNRYEYPIPIK